MDALPPKKQRCACCRGSLDPGPLRRARSCPAPAVAKALASVLNGAAAVPASASLPLAALTYTALLGAAETVTLTVPLVAELPAASHARAV